MLVLSRIPGEEITLFLESGERITVKLLNIKNRLHSSEAIIAIKAPQNVTILRNELLDRYPNCNMQDYDIVEE